MDQAPLSVGNYRQAASLLPIPDYTSHSYKCCPLSQPAGALSARFRFLPTHIVPLANLCSAPLPLCVRCRMWASWEVLSSLWKLEILRSPATNSAPGKQGKQYLKSPGQILSKDLSYPQENPFCLAPLSNIAQTPVSAQEPPATTAWEWKLYHKKSPRFTSPHIPPQPSSITPRPKSQVAFFLPILFQKLLAS